MKLVRAALLAVIALCTSLATAADDRPALVIAVNELPRGLEPADDTGNVDIRATYSIFDTLLRRDFTNNSLKPLLAESWKRVGPTILEVKLRRDVVFHNGDPFDADDVVFTFSPERLRGANAVIPAGRQYFGHLREVQKVDSHTVRFITDKPDLVFEHDWRLTLRWIVSHRRG